MISPSLYSSSSTYDFFIKLLGYERSIDRFLGSLKLNCPDNCRVLDAGCGTGLLGLHFLQRYDQATLTATDLEKNFLEATLANADKRHIDRSRITVGTADISSPDQFTLLDDTSQNLPDNSFDVICIGAVIGYASDTEASMRKLLQLLAPNGYLINIEMNESMSGRYVSRKFHYNNIPLARMKQIITQENCIIEDYKMRLGNLPAKLTRTSIVARKVG